jgi:DNA-binding PadR family transcriptional regulator
MSAMSLRTLKDMHERTIKNFLDLIILKELRTNANISGYDIITVFEKRFHMHFSPGSVYSILRGMQQKGLLAIGLDHGRKVYSLTKLGEEEAENVQRNLDKILFIIKSTFSEKSLY